MVEFLDDTNQLESNTIGVFRSAATMAGGRRFSFGSLVVVGDKGGRIGLGYGKANEVPAAIEKAQKDAKKNLKRVNLQGGTIPHEVQGRYGASSVKLIPASPGTGVVAGATVRAVLELAGITDCMTKSSGSNNSKNLAKAVLDGLIQLRSKDTFATLRGVEIGDTEVDERIDRGSAFMPTSTTDAEKMRGPVNRVGEDSRGRGGRGGRGGGRGGRSGGPGRGRSGGGQDSGSSGSSSGSSESAPESSGS
ncbi:MAG: 30S ribosomal protein S5 [bacterium]|nr:30S ribosomal protein S5 [bacterium]